MVSVAKDFLERRNFFGTTGNHGCLCLIGYGAGG
jgi:hypothetical protein